MAGLPKTENSIWKRIESLCPVIGMTPEEFIVESLEEGLTQYSIDAKNLVELSDVANEVLEGLAELHSLSVENMVELLIYEEAAQHPGNLLESARKKWGITNG